jgi:hypothetical protein
MPFYYDLNYSVTTAGTAGSEATYMAGKTVSANQETVSLVGLYLASRFGTAGGAQARIKTLGNGGTAATGGTPQTPFSRNLRASAAGLTAQSTWLNGTNTITPGTGTLTTRITVGFAQTGGMGGWVPITPQDAIQMMPDTLNPVDAELTTLANAATVTCDSTLEIGEGV